jgi:hypothetical protein
MNGEQGVENAFEQEQTEITEKYESIPPTLFALLAPVKSFTTETRPAGRQSGK